MSWSSYGSFLVFALVLILIPGPDFAVVTRNTLASGRRRGVWSAVGVTGSNAVQGVAASAGLGALVVRSQPLFETILAHVPGPEVDESAPFRMLATTLQYDSFRGRTAVGATPAVGETTSF